MIEARTKAALSAKKSQGIVLGNCANLAVLQAKRQAANATRAAEFAAKVLPQIMQMRSQKIAFDQVGEKLTACNVLTLNDATWHVTTVSGLLKSAP